MSTRIQSRKINQNQTTRILRLRRPHQTPHRSRSQILHSHTRHPIHTTTRDHHQPRRIQTLLLQPLLHQPQRTTHHPMHQTRHTSHRP
ncbi:hypothetical protein AB0E10_44860, partial [Streptomyces sp. NPDC048045]|uniref:hypothetical protein n=1 Tax=Streptomyces sp. NPDC048045 TaxID=3154710 RepID=UPI003414C4B1